MTDYSHFTWTLFITTNDDVYHAFKGLAKVIQNEKNSCISTIKSDHGGEFQNERFEIFCEKFGIKHCFTTPKNSTAEWSCEKEEQVFGGTRKHTFE